jgi:secondary thiamine-phosphate synthase enzyme
MKAYRKELWFELPRRRAMVNITPQIEQCLAESGIREGLCLVNAMHITASVFINDDESGLHADFERWLERLAPEKPHSAYDHNRTGEDNADAHLKRTIRGVRRSAPQAGACENPRRITIVTTQSRNTGGT